MKRKTLLSHIDSGDGNDSCVILHYVESHPAIF